MLVAFAMLASNAFAANVAKIGDTEYATFEEAFTALSDGQTLELLSDVTLVNRMSKWGNSTDSMTVDLKGFTITCVANMTALDSEHDYDAVFDIWNVRILFQNGTINDNANTTGTTINSIEGAHVTTNDMHIMFTPNGINEKGVINYGSLVADEGSKLYVNNCVVDITNGCGVQICSTSEGYFMNSQFTQTTDKTKQLPGQQNCLAASSGGVVKVYSGRFISDKHCLRVYNSGGAVYVLGPAVLKGTSTTLSIDNSTASVDWEGKPNYAGPGYAYITSGEWQGDVISTQISNQGVYSIEVTGGRYFQQPSNIAKLTIKTGYSEMDNKDGSWSVVKTEDKKTDFSAVDENSVVVPAEDTEVEGEKEVKQINVAGVDLVVKDNAVLTVGKGGVIVGKDGEGNYGKIMVEAGGKLVVNGLVYNDSIENIVILSDENKSGEFLISPDVALYGDQRPSATVEMVANIGKNSDDNYAWYRFGCPMSEVTSFTRVEHTATTYIQKWDAATGEWVNITSLSDFKAFEGYYMSTDADYNNYKYAFTGKLFGNTNSDVTFDGEAGQWAYFANSYTGRASAQKILEEAIASNELHSIKLWDESKKTFDQNVTIAKITMGLVNPNLLNIAPLRPVVFKAAKADPTLKFNYREAIWEVANPQSQVVARKAAPSYDAIIFLTFGNAEVDMYANETLSDDFDSETDSEYQDCGDAIKAYAVVGKSNLSSVGRKSLHETTIEIVANADTTINVSCTYLLSGDYALIDADSVKHDISQASDIFTISLEKNVPVQLTLVDNNQPTSLENVKTVAAKGLYSVTGLYLGEDIQALPSGMYIYNGKKVVK